MDQSLSIGPHFRRPAGYSPEQITILISAHEAACAVLGVRQTESVKAEAVALQILEHAAKGEFDPDRLRDYAVHALRDDRTLGST
jgi:hypothetical protein